MIGAVTPIGTFSTFSNSQKKEGVERLNPEQEKEVKKLQERDREVRTHEQAHVNALGGYARGGPSYEFTTGPDGKQYATGGEVSVDLSKESTPDKTVQKMQTIRRAALAPAEPSSADKAVAARASQLEAEARAELQDVKPERVGVSPQQASQAYSAISK